MLGLDRITFNPKIMAGQACIRAISYTLSGHRLYVFECLEFQR